MFAIKVSSLIKNWVQLVVFTIGWKKRHFAICLFVFQFKFNLLELLSQGESDSLIKT